MKRILFFLLAVVVFSSCNQKGSDEGFVIEKGVNIAHWLSQSGARGEFRAKYFTEADVARIAQWGFDHVRIPIGQTITEQQIAERPAAEQEAFGRWTNETYDKERFAREFSMAANVAKKYGIPVYCGEYGCLSDEPNDDMRYRWLTDVNDIFDELGIARAVWCYREGEDGFGILSGMECPIDQKMLDALLK